ncbi:uncharacterized protein [Drosophila takahashii]|uniref:uncharacterized protein n=1 Tax=Drosophila takahashii TaxID=29030 RepID=UPI001CF7F2A1|nr:uncharacterized protein LOC108059067 [Drosophila takahashii]
MSKQFLTEFIFCLQNEPALWQANSEAYKNKSMRNKGWEMLLHKLQENDPEATIDTVKKKVNSLRATYRRESKKIKRSEKSGDIYQPSIWYFKELSFLDEINTFDEDDGPEIEMAKAAPKRKHDEDKKAVANLENLTTKKTRDDADIFAEGWAVMFRQLSEEQQLYAKKGIDEILLQGRLNMLTYHAVSRIGIK